MPPFPQFLRNWEQALKSQLCCVPGNRDGRGDMGPARSCRGHVRPPAVLRDTGGDTRAAPLPASPALPPPSSSGTQLSNESLKTQTRSSSSLGLGGFSKPENPGELQVPCKCGSGQASSPLITSGVTGASQDMDLSHIPHIQRGTMTAFQGYITPIMHFIFLRKRMDSMTNKQH